MKINEADCLIDKKELNRIGRQFLLFRDNVLNSLCSDKIAVKIIEEDDKKVLYVNPADKDHPKWNDNWYRWITSEDLLNGMYNELFGSAYEYPGT